MLRHFFVTQGPGRAFSRAAGGKSRAAEPFALTRTGQLLRVSSALLVRAVRIQEALRHAESQHVQIIEFSMHEQHDLVELWMKDCPHCSH